MIDAKISHNLTRLFNTFAAGAPDVKPVRDILLVGATLDLGQGTLSKNDEYYLTNTLEQLSMADIPMASTPHVSVCNLAYGDDFLAAKFNQTYDAVLFCYVYHAPDAAGILTAGGSRQSLRAADENAWHDALVKSGADVAVVAAMDAYSSLPPELFDKDPFTQTARTKINDLCWLDVFERKRAQTARAQAIQGFGHT